MALDISAFWHRESFDRFLKDQLPQLLAARMPLVGYHVESTGLYTCRVKVAFASASGDVEVEYTDIPQPDEEGIFEVEGVKYVVVPIASQEELDLAEIRCVGEQLYHYFEERLGEAPEDLPWDESLARAWLPLNVWMREFLHHADLPWDGNIVQTAQTLHEQNWLDRHAQLRRIVVTEPKKMFTPGHFGRTCPFETPEGPNIGRILSIATSAEISDGKLVIVNDKPEASIGLAASMVPFLEHNDPNRQLMGVNMMRQWFVPPEVEPALVQTGNEPDAPGFWCGRNLLTAFVSWGADTFEDGIAVGKSCAERLNYPYPVEVGDKLSNRHGTKGVVAKILPDNEMPHLADGTPIELVFNFIGVHSRMNLGQLREAVTSRIAKAEGAPAIVPPFHAPGGRELRERLREAGLPEDGMEVLILGRDGMKLCRPSTVGWVYWGRLNHLARNKIFASTDHSRRCQKQGELEYYTLRDVGAFENLMEHFNTRALRRDDADKLADRVAEGAVEQAGPPTPGFSEIARRLAAGGIQAELEGEKLTFKFAKPEGDTLKLARPVAHPWIGDRELDEIGAFDEPAEYRALAEVNAKAERMIASDAPESLTRKAFEQLQTHVGKFFDALLGSPHLRFGEHSLFSGRTVISLGADLRIDQLGLPEEIAWTLFGPLVRRELSVGAVPDRSHSGTRVCPPDSGEHMGSPLHKEEVDTRSPRATEELDEIMARSWVLLQRIMPTSFLAFHPVRCPGRTIHIHPLVCSLMNTDFDGDQAAVFLPITEGAQREAGERLSVAGHVARDPELLNSLLPPHEAMWGIASLSLTPEGRKEVSQLAGTDVTAPDGFITKDSLAEAMRSVLERDGIEGTLAALERLMRRGFEVAKESGASISPFIGSSLKRSPEPEEGDAEMWDEYAEELSEQIISRTDFEDNDLGPQLLAIKSGARGQLRQLAYLVGARGTATDVRGRDVPIRCGYSDGLTPQEMYTAVVGAREGLAQTALETWTRFGLEFREARQPKGFNVLARAMRAKRPAIVFTRAAATGEIDPLTDVDSRLFVGLRAKLVDSKQ